MRKLLIALAAFVLAMSACQKEVSLENPNSTPGFPQQPLGLLSRLVNVAGNDSVVYDYGYDASKRFLKMDVNATSGTSQSTRIVRNAAGVMTQYISKRDDLVNGGIDSIVTNVSHDPVALRYTWAISTVTVGGVTYKDSAAFTYNSSGNLATITSYAKTEPGTYLVYSKIEYGYTAGNISSEKYYSMGQGGTWELDNSYNYSYDSKFNPLKLGEEAMIALDNGSLFSLNNVSVLDYVDATDPTYNYSLVTTYTYTPDNKPAGASVTQEPGSSTYDVRYYYK